MARTLARDAVDGILIGEEGGHKIYELRESGKLVYRGKAAPEEPDNENQAISRIIMSGSNYLALASKSSLRRRLTDGEWITEGLKDDTPILDFAIWGSGEYATIDKMNPKITIHPETGKKRDIRFDRKHGSKNELISKASDLKSTKVIAGVDGDVFAVFKRTRSQSDMGSSQTFSESDTQPVTCGWASFNGSIFDNILTYQDIDWSIAEPHKTRKLVVDFHLGPSKKYDDVWFLTPKGLGRLNKGKTEYWDTPFELEDGIELSTIRDLGDDNFMLFTTDGLFTHDVYHLRRKK